MDTQNQHDQETNEKLEAIFKEALADIEDIRAEYRKEVDEYLEELRKEKIKKLTNELH